MFVPRRSPRIAATKPGTSKKQPPKGPKKPRRPRAKKPGPQPPAIAADGPPELVYLRVSRRFLNLLPAVTADQPNSQPLPPLPGTTGHLNVIIASLQDLHPYAGDTVDWLIRVARLIFEPLGTSSLFTFTEDTLDSWLGKDMNPPQWRQVEQGEPLRATIYEFRPNNNVFITLSKISLRQEVSVITKTSQPQATAFRATIRARDTTCIISQNPFFLIASHLVPKRLGDVGTTSVVQRFTGSDAAVTRFNPTLGVLLFRPLDSMVDNYDIGFWNSAPNQYVIHSFWPTHLNIYGGPPLTPVDPMLHHRTIALPTNDASFPHIGVFNWHYLQCVLRRFATDEYRQTQNINCFTVPFRTRDEDEDDESNFSFDDERNIANPPYPSYLIELAEVRMRQHLEDEERNQAILTWNSNVQVTTS